MSEGFPSLLQSRAGDLVTPSAILFLLSSATVSSVTAAAVEPPLLSGSVRCAPGSVEKLCCGYGCTDVLADARKKDTVAVAKTSDS